jgi:hypothetical protein
MNLIELFAREGCQVGNPKMTRVGVNEFKSHTRMSHEEYGEVYKNPFDDHGEGFWFSRTIE